MKPETRKGTYENLARKNPRLPTEGRSHPRRRRGRPVRLRKTTFAAQLAVPLEAPVIHMDDIFPGWDGLAEATPLLVEWVLEPLAKDLPARYRRFEWHAMEYAEWNEVPPTEALVVEGVGSGARPTHLSCLVWIEAPRELRMRRGIERDGEAFRPHWERWARQENAMFRAERTRERADLVVDGSPEITHDPEREFVRRFALRRNGGVVKAEFMDIEPRLQPRFLRQPPLVRENTSRLIESFVRSCGSREPPTEFGTIHLDSV